MKIIVFTTHAAVLPIIEYFHSQGWLSLVVSTEKLSGNNLQIEDFCISRGTDYLKINRSQLLSTVQDRLLAIQPDMIIMLGFSYRIPQEIYNIPCLGFYNVHFSLLPSYKGTDPIFWQMKNGETTGGITIHEVDDDFDSGKIVLQQVIPFIPGETAGICNGRYAVPTFQLVQQLIEKLLSAGETTDFPIDSTSHNSIPESYFTTPVPDDFAIRWDTDTASQIENLVNACNPSVGGAVSVFRQQMVRILEVSPVDGEGEVAVPGGTVIHADGSGLYVQCTDRKILRINIIKVNEGFMTGFKLAALGVVKGDRLESTEMYQLINIIN